MAVETGTDVPANASVNGDGFRMYEWPGATPGADLELLQRYGATEPHAVLSVTSIRTLAGEPFQLVNWKVGNVVNVAMGQRAGDWRDYSKSKRGRLVHGYIKDGPFPGEFMTRLVATRGNEVQMDDLRRWLRESADEPRDVAAVRGSVVHKLIELNAPLDRVTEESVRERFDKQWAEEKRKVKPAVTDEDVFFVVNAMANYWDMRLHVPFVVLAQEPQVWNLEAGYAGSLDGLFWFLGHFDSNNDFVPLPGATPELIADWQRRATAGTVSLDDIRAVGGFVAVGDWKTSKGVYTNHVVQVTAYMGATFVGRDGVIDPRLTAILEACMTGVLVHIRPNSWAVDPFVWNEGTFMAFLGSCTFARFLAMNKRPDDLFIKTIRGSANGEPPEGTQTEEEAAPDAA